MNEPLADDLLEQLAKLEITPPPAEFDRQLHQRVNRALLARQVIDLGLGALPWSMLHFARALLGLVAFSVTGRYGDDGGVKKNSQSL